jgi:hypothetical protein
MILIACPDNLRLIHKLQRTVWKPVAKRTMEDADAWNRCQHCRKQRPPSWLVNLPIPIHSSNPDKAPKTRRLKGRKSWGRNVYDMLPRPYAAVRRLTSRVTHQATERRAAQTCMSTWSPHADEADPDWAGDGRRHPKSLSKPSRRRRNLRKRRVSMKDNSAAIEALRAQERALVLSEFDEQAAYSLRLALRAKCAAVGAPVVIDIRSASRRLFFAALPSSAADNDDWARHKGNVVLRRDQIVDARRRNTQIGEPFAMARPCSGCEGFCSTRRWLSGTRARRRRRRVDRNFRPAVVSRSRYDRHDPGRTPGDHRCRSDPRNGPGLLQFRI